MKKSELIISAIIVPLDYLMIILAALAAYGLRYLPLVQEVRPVIFDLPFKQYFIWSLAIAIFWLLIFALAGLYVIGGTRRLIDEFTKIFLACSTGILAVIVGFFFSRYLFSSRFILLAAWPISIIFVSSERLIIRLIQRSLFRRGIGVHKVVLVGNHQTGETIIKELEQKPTLGYKIMKIFQDTSQNTFTELKNLASEIDEIVQIDPDISRSESLKLIDFANEHHLIFKYAADLLGARVVNLEVEAIAGTPIVEIKKTSLEGWGRIFKRLFDILAAVILIILFSPVMLMTAIAIKLNSKGPVFFKYQRVGEKGRSFNFLKFRSMIEGAHGLRFDQEFLAQQENLRAGTPMMKFKDDPRITKVGKFIRRWSIDELPQLFLVLIGKMSLVGPRPHEVEEVARYQKHHRKVLTLKPGMTGLAQISGRSDIDFEEEVKLDSYYIENWSPKLDIAILFRTPWAVIKKRAAE